MTVTPDPAETAALPEQVLTATAAYFQSKGMTPAHLRAMAVTVPLMGDVADAWEASVLPPGITRAHVSWWAPRFPSWAEVAAELGITDSDAPDPETAARWAELDAIYAASLAAIAQTPAPF